MNNTNAIGNRTHVKRVRGEYEFLDFPLDK